MEAPFPVGIIPSPKYMLFGRYLEGIQPAMAGRMLPLWQKVQYPLHEAVGLRVSHQIKDVGTVMIVVMYMSICYHSKYSIAVAQLI